MTFDELPDRGVAINPAHRALYRRAQELFPERPLVFDLSYSEPGSSGGARIYETRIKIWLNPANANPASTLAHELAQVINYAEHDAPRLHPERPRGIERRVLSDLVSIPEHRIVHETLARLGFSTHEESLQRCTAFLDNIRLAPFAEDGSNLHLSVGYAMMLTVYRDESVIDKVISQMRSRCAVVATLGEGLANYVNKDRETSLYQDAVALMEIARIGAEFRECVYSPEQFRQEFGWL